MLHVPKISIDLRCFSRSFYCLRSLMTEVWRRLFVAWLFAEVDPPPPTKFDNWLEIDVD